MLFPKKVKFRKWQRARKHEDRRGRATRGADVMMGSYGLKTVDQARIRSYQIEAARKVISRTIGKSGKIWIRVFPDRPYTQKGAETPMGAGKGDVQGYEVEVLPGRVLFEVDGVKPEVARAGLEKAASKLPVRGKVVSRT